MALLLNHLVSFVSRDEMYHRGNHDFTWPSHGLMAARYVPRPPILPSLLTIASLWTFSASLSVLSTRYLLIELNYRKSPPPIRGPLLTNFFSRFS